MFDIFLSWSNDKSRQIAQVFAIELPYIIQSKKVFYSPVNIPKGEGWYGHIEKVLKTVQAGIVFLTRENMTNPWILFEAGALCAKGNVNVLLCDLEINDTKNHIWGQINLSDLSTFDDVLKLLCSIRTACGLSVDDSVLKENLISRWDSMSLRIKEILFPATVIPTNSTIPSEFQGEWTFRATNSQGQIFGEKAKIDSDGKYHLWYKGDFIYYFQLKVISGLPNFEIQKLQLFDDKPIPEHIYSTEKLIFEDNTFTGTDTFGFSIQYLK